MTTAAYRRRARSSSGSRWMQLRYPGDCKMCGEHLAAGATAYWDSATHRITCEDLECCERDGLTREETVWDGTAAGRRVHSASRPPHRTGSARCRCPRECSASRRSPLFADEDLLAEPKRPALRSRNSGTSGRRRTIARSSRECLAPSFVGAECGGA
jgi:hypothetical protein